MAIAPARRVFTAKHPVPGVINATLLGMQGCPGCAAPLAQLRSAIWVADVLQGARGFELICGVKPDAARMSRHFNALLAASH